MTETTVNGTPGPKSDRDLIQIVDSAMAEAVRKSGTWLACRPGCTECCIGPFPINALDAIRMRKGMAELEARDAKRARDVHMRARASVERMRHEYPEDTLENILAIEEAGKDEPCPALDPATGLCDLYEYRPVTCRTFGPAVRFGGNGVAVCELCYRGAAEAEIAACEVEVDPDNVEAKLLSSLPEGDTVIAFILADGRKL